MNHKSITRLNKIREFNKELSWVNRDLYRLLYKEDLFIIAYERIKSKPGNMTPGSDGQTIDGMSLKRIGKIISKLRDESFQFTPVRRSEIDKNDGGKRKLGIPSSDDKLVQEVMRMILEAIYDSPKNSYFYDESHGFRSNKSCHTALNEFRNKWSGVNWIIEGDIKSCFDDINHQKLIEIIKEKIDDEKFIRLLWKLLRAGYMDEIHVQHDSLAGTPQGGIVSPILANIYLHQLDRKVLELKLSYTNGKLKKPNPEYRKHSRKRQRLVKQNIDDRHNDEIKELTKIIRGLPSAMVNDPDFIRVKYLRYADDWIIGISGPKSLAQEIKDDLKTFLEKELFLTLSETKTKIINAKKEQAKFLGTLLSVGKGVNSEKLTTSTNSSGVKFKRRSTGMETNMLAPIDNLVKRLNKKGFCDGDGQPITKTQWVPLDAPQTINLFNSINRGILNYYKFADNYGNLTGIQYILKYSLAKTLAAKYKTSVKKIFEKYGDNLTVTYQDDKGNNKSVSFATNRNWKRTRNGFMLKANSLDIVRMHYKLRTRSKLDHDCCICGSSVEVSMHHVKHIRKMNQKTTGFTKLMATMNRKQIPVCETCHKDIHKGKYDGMKLSQLAYIPN